MEFELLDRYLLDRTPPKGELVAALLAQPAHPPAARPFYEGIRRLGARTPDLALIALRLTLAGRTADDATVTRVRDLVARVRAGGSDGDEARASYVQVMG
jgi:hypothetical protein